MTHTVQDKAKDPHPNLQIHSIRGNPKFTELSHQMLKVIDMKAMKGDVQSPSFEFAAMQ